MRARQIKINRRRGRIGRIRQSRSAVSVEDLSILTGNTGATNRTNILAALTASKSKYELYMPAKTFQVAGGGISMPDDTCIFGEGQESVLNWASALSTGARYIASSNTVDGIANVGLFNFRINGGHTGAPWGDSATYGDPAHGVFINNVSNLKIHGVYVYRVPGIAIGYQQYDGVDIAHCITEESGRDGVTGFIINNRGSNASVRHCHVIKPGDDAFAIGAGSGSGGTEATVSNIGNLVEATDTVFADASVEGQYIAIHDGDGSGIDFEGHISRWINTSEVEVTPTPLANVVAQDAVFGYGKSENILFEDIELTGWDEDKTLGLGRMLQIAGAHNVTLRGGNFDRSFFSGILLNGDPDNNLIRTKYVNISDVVMNGIGEQTTTYSGNLYSIRLGGADYVALTNIAVTGDKEENGTTIVAWDPANTYSYTKTNVTFENNPSNDTDEIYP